MVLYMKSGYHSTINMTPVPVKPTIKPTHSILIPMLQIPLPSCAMSKPLPVCDGSCDPSTFNPNFDLIEFSDFFGLCGELPGVQHDDVEIEFISPQTIIVGGRTRRSYNFQTPTSQITSVIEAIECQDGEPVLLQTPENEPNTDTFKPLLAGAVDEKYWISERHDRTFSRSFTFHAQVNLDSVQAYMMNGLLTITLRKA